MSIKTVKIGNYDITEIQYRDFFNRYETITDTNRIEPAKQSIKDLKKRGYKTKYKTVSFMDLLREICITYKAIKIKFDAISQPYDNDLIDDWLKW